MVRLTEAVENLFGTLAVETDAIVADEIGGLARSLDYIDLDHAAPAFGDII
jgi:hypothetical protein